MDMLLPRSDSIITIIIIIKFLIGQAGNPLATEVYL